jgi:DNA-binding NtrC family response regulator
MPPTTVLVIDDLGGVRDSLADLLRHHGYQVLTAGSGAEAEAVRARQGLDRLDVVITNLRLTRLPHAREGADLIQRWHELAPRLPFILISADLRPHELPDLPTGMVWYVAKPFTIAEILATVQEALSR